ncbi:hypothetical protein Purlil1_5813 [Purpureocillium lilacinum]|uniref:Uncharacterized protein n=1 Tax=Purpureocillium lilacinum TaxID=33203 RepID=A0ABR0C0I3_PURLI|nr:hypothetical protein Purlil1_5813 [Purpureocillium lilacinum]
MREEEEEGIGHWSAVPAQLVHEPTRSQLGLRTPLPVENEAGCGGASSPGRGGRRPSHRQDVVGRESRCVVGGRRWDRAAGTGVEGHPGGEGRGGVGRLSTAMAARRGALAACIARPRGPVAALARGGHCLEGSRGRAAGVYLCRLIGPPLASHCRALSGRRQWGAP